MDNDIYKSFSRASESRHKFSIKKRCESFLTRFSSPSRRWIWHTAIGWHKFHYKIRAFLGGDGERSGNIFNCACIIFYKKLTLIALSVCLSARKITLARIWTFNRRICEKKVSTKLLEFKAKISENLNNETWVKIDFNSFVFTDSIFVYPAGRVCVSCLVDTLPWGSKLI